MYDLLRTPLTVAWAPRNKNESPGALCFWLAQVLVQPVGEVISLEFRCTDLTTFAKETELLLRSSFASSIPLCARNMQTNVP